MVFYQRTKAFDCVKHGLAIAKIHAYYFDRNAILIIHSYLSERKQRTKINYSFSKWHDKRLLCHKVLVKDLYYSIYILIICFTS